MHRFFARLAVLGFAAVAAGCGQSQPTQMDVKEARQALDAALSAWKAGESAESLREREPPVDFSDPAWEKGSKLAKYEVEKEEPFGMSARFTVKLYLGEQAGKGPRRVVYTADAGERVVIRPDFGS